jgi:UDP-2-acetamido-2,6-beta-L-arabino-hexul-4-ose reductase
VRIAVTGPTGLVGWHLCCALSAAGHEAVKVDRAAFASDEALVEAVNGADAVVHAAGANRGPDEDVFMTNVGLAERLAGAVESCHDQPHVVFTNSTHIERDTPYGESKRRAAEILGNAASSGFTNLVLPGIFGEHGRPNYNSVVSTFADQLALGATLSINDDADLELMHAQDAADVIIDAVSHRHPGTARVAGERTSVAQIAARLVDLADRYDQGVIPDISSHFDRSLFNTMRSYRFPARYPPMALEPRRDQRGSLVEVVRSDTGGQSFVSWTNPGVTRGNHFHRRKVERFVVLEGTARISLRRLGYSDVISFDVSGSNPMAIDIPTLYTHKIENTGDGLLTTLFWADEIFDADHPDTVFEEV